MGSQYLITRRWALGNRFTVTDGAETPLFEVSSKAAFGRKMSLCDTEGTEAAAISHRAFTRHYQILSGGKETIVRPRGFFGRRFEIESPAGPMEARGNFTGREYAVTASGVPAVTVKQLRTLRERFTVDVADGQDDVLMLAVVLIIETIRDDRRRNAG